MSRLLIGSVVWILVLLAMPACQDAPSKMSAQPFPFRSPADVEQTGPRLDGLTFEAIDLSTLPPPIGTGSPPPRNDPFGAPLVYPTNGGLPFSGFEYAYSSGGIPSVASLGSPSLEAASTAAWAGYDGTAIDTLIANVLPIVLDWDTNAVMVSAIGLLDNTGRISTAKQFPGHVEPELVWIFAFRSTAKDEALLFAVTHERTKLVRLTFKSPIVVDASELPHLNGLLIDTGVLLEKLQAALRQPDVLIDDEKAAYVPILPTQPPSELFQTVGGAIPFQARLQVIVAETACRSMACRPSYEVFPDSRWRVFLYEEKLTNGEKRLVWYALLQPGQLGAGLKGGAAKIDAQSGKLLMLSRPLQDRYQL